jgi:hypothetical protein
MKKSTKIFTNHSSKFFFPYKKNSHRPAEPKFSHIDSINVENPTLVDHYPRETMGFSTVLQVKIPAKSRGPMPLWALDGGT